MASTWTSEDVAVLSAAMASGIKRVIYDGPPKREIEYQSLSEMSAVLADMVRQVAGSSTPSRRLVKTVKGFR